MAPVLKQHEQAASSLATTRDKLQPQNHYMHCNTQAVCKDIVECRVNMHETNEQGRR